MIDREKVSAFATLASAMRSVPVADVLREIDVVYRAAKNTFTREACDQIAERVRALK